MHIFWFFCFLASLASTQGDVTSKRVYIDPSQGTDDVTCGHSLKPCKNLRFAWDKTIKIETNTSTEVSFLLHPGVYNEDQNNNQPLFYKCNHESIETIVIEKFENRTSLPVHIYYSFQISSCKIKFTGLNLKNGAYITAYDDANVHINRCTFKSTWYASLKLVQSDVLINDVIFEDLNLANQIVALRSNKVTITNSYFRNISLAGVIDKPFIDTQSVRILSLANITIAENTGTLNKEGSEMGNFININDVTSVYMENISVQRNDNVDFRITDTSTLNVRNLIMTDNVNSTLSFQNVNGSVTGALLKNRFADEDRATISLKQSLVRFEHVVISCAVTQKLAESPITADATANVKCTNCSVVNCKNICGKGFQRVKSVFCAKCSGGSSAHAWEKRCHQCHPGYYSSQPGAVDCKPCAAGTFCKERGCKQCKQCKNEMFTSLPGSVSCSQMSLLFIILVGVTLLFIMVPVAVKVIKVKRVKTKNEDGDDEDDDANDYDTDVKTNPYTKFKDSNQI